MKASFSTKSQKNGVVFKPLIATSLALALGISVGNASNEKPNITLNSSTSNELNIHWLGDSDYYKMSHNGSNALTNFSFYLENNGDTNISTDNSSYTAHISPNTNSIAISTTSSGIKMGDNGKGTLTIGGGNKSDGQSKTMTLNLNNLFNSEHYALMGNLSIDNWQTGSTTAKIGGKGIKGDVTLKAVAGTNTFTFNNNAGIEGKLILKSGNHNVTFGNNTDPSTTPTSYTPKITGNIQATGGNTTIKGLTAIEGNISLDSGEGGTNHTQTHIIFNGASANIGTQGKNSNITLNLRLASGGGTWKHTGMNTIISNSSTNNFKLGEMKVDGNYGSTNPQNRTFNIISLNQNDSTKNSTSNNISINTTHSSYGNNIIGKGVVTSNNNSTIAYNSTMFGSTNSPSIQNGFITEFVKAEHSIKGVFNFGDNLGDIKNAFISNACGGNYININGTTTIKGNILSENKHSSAGSTNTLILTGTSSTLGEDNKKISITIDNASRDGYGYRSYSNNTLLLGADTNTLHVSNLSVRGDYGSTNPQSRTFNILSFNNGNQNNGSNTGNINSISASGGYNIIGKDLITQGGGYNSTLFGSNTPTIQSNFSTNFAKDSHNAKGAYSIGSISANGGTNYINVENLTISSSISAIGGENLIVAKTLMLNSSSIMAGNGGYGAKNVFDVSGDVNFRGNLVIKADNTTNTNTEKHNIFKISGNTTADQTIAELTAITGNSHHSRTMNILSFEGGANSSNSLTIESINKPETIGNWATGYNYIGKALTQGEGLGMNLVSNFANSWNSTNHQANLTLDVNNGIYAKYGKNYINVTSLSVSGDIDGNAGHNYISTNTLTSNGAIKARWRGSNTIIVDGTSTIDGNIEAGSIGHSDFGVNNLTFGGEATISGSILFRTPNTSNQNNITLSKASSSLTLKGEINQISTLTALATIDNDKNQNNTLTLDATNNSITTSIKTLINGDNLKIDFNGANDKSITLTLNTFGNSNANLRSVSASNGTDNTLAFNQSATIIDPINKDSVASGKGLTLQVNSGATLHAQGGINKKDGGDINVNLNNGILTFGTNANHISNLSGNGIVNLSSHTPNTLQISQTTTGNKGLRNSLTIDNFTSGETTFKLFASSTQNDRVIFNGGDKTAKAIISLVGGSDIHDITYNGHLNADNTLVAQTNNGSEMVVEGGESLIGIDRIRIELISTTENQTTNYYVGKVVDLGVDPVFQEMSNTALMINYDLFLANFNSLNKRMGELRDNANNHGVWGRVFGGSTSNSFGAGSTTNYITTQVGYDYSIDVGENARNYTGIALAYGSSTTKSKALNITASTSLINTISLDNIKSNVIELGLYNAYVADNGWYNDTIFKFNYLMSEFSMSNNSSSMSKINNLAFILSDEFGYRYKFAENEKGNWFIDPQLEVAVGYFNQSDFVRTVFDYSSDLYAYQDAIFTLRTRIGASLGKKFNTEKGFATLYAGAFYEHDYIKGGASESKGGGSQMIAQLESIHSNDRAIVNIGSNIELTEGARLYIDVEKSFGEKQRTHMQFNLGARYSF